MRISWTGPLFFAALTGAGVAAAHPHSTSPPVHLSVDVEGTEVTASLVVDKRLLLSWAEGRRIDPELAFPAVTALEIAAERLDVRVDDHSVAPTLVKVAEPYARDPEAPRQVVTIALAFPAARPPTRLSVRWKDFDGVSWEGEVSVPVTIVANHAVDTRALEPAEPEMTWHARPDAPLRIDPSSLAPDPDGGVRIPVLSVALALAGLVLFLVLVRRHVPVALRAGLPALLLGAAFLAPATLRVRVPWGGPPPPTPEQAKAIFETLQGNVYRAFDAGEEEEIYDLLAASVEAPLLDGLYQTVYQSLIVREQGGAVARAEAIEPLETSVDVAPEGGFFRVEAAWHVRGVVAHWGHEHRQVVAYRAKAAVRHGNGSWRIAAIEMLENRRVDEPAAAPAGGPTR